MVEVFTYFWNNSCQPLGDAKRSWWCGTNPADFAGGVAIAVPLWFVGGWPYGQQARGCRVILIILMQPCWFVAGSMSGGWLAGRCRKIDSLEVVATNAIGIFWASCEVKRMVTFVRSCHRRFPPWCWLPFVLEFCMHFLILRHWCFVYPSIHDIRFSSSQITAFMFWGMVGSVRGSRAKEASSRSLWHTPAQSGDPELCWQNAFVPRYIFWRFHTLSPIFILQITFCWKKLHLGFHRSSRIHWRILSMPLSKRALKIGTWPSNNGTRNISPHLEGSLVGMIQSVQGPSNRVRVPQANVLVAAPFSCLGRRKLTFHTITSSLTIASSHSRRLRVGMSAFAVLATTFIQRFDSFAHSER